MSSKELVLASSSPRRVELLKEAGFSFRVIPSRYKENLYIVSDPRKTAEILAYGKANEVAGRVRNAIVIGADTIVTIGQRKLGKPRDRTDARNMLEKLSGQWHSVFTGYAIIQSSPPHTTKRRVVETRVKFRDLTRKEISEYTNNRAPLNHAGAYAIQDKEADLVEKYEGSLTNVIGLPMEALLEDLKAFF